MLSFTISLLFSSSFTFWCPVLWWNKILFPCIFLHIAIHVSLVLTPKSALGLWRFKSSGNYLKTLCLKLWSLEKIHTLALEEGLFCYYILSLQCFAKLLHNFFFLRVDWKKTKHIINCGNFLAHLSVLGNDYSFSAFREVLAPLLSLSCAFGFVLGLAG